MNKNTLLIMASVGRHLISRGEMNKRSRNMKPYKAGENRCQIST